MKLKISTAEQLSTHFKSLRKAKGWSQADLGKRIGLKQARVAQIEGDPGSISVDKLFQVLHALDADVVIETQGSDAGKAKVNAVELSHWIKATRSFKLLAPPSRLTEDLKQSLNLISTPSGDAKRIQALSQAPAPDKTASGQAGPKAGDEVKQSKD